MTNNTNAADHTLYSNAFGFMRQPVDFNPTQSNADLVVIGLPFDLATTGRSGARMGPEAIRKASVHLCWEEKKFPWDFKLTDRISIIDAGDLLFEPGDAEHFMQQAEQHFSSIIDSGKTLMAFGGDHFVTLPLLRAHNKRYGEMALIHFDAHTDTYSEGSRFDHGTMFYHAPKENLIDPSRSIQIGIRTHYDQTNHPFKVISGPEANTTDSDVIIQQIKDRVGDKPVYITFDIDCLDPAFAPGTGTPVCGGLTSDKVLNIIRGLSGTNIVGMDVVEVAPAYDQADVTALAGATVALELLYAYSANK
ncbi:MAG: agmatinase [Kangiellaceae bacterium]|nr:agmatinase [Kangiellaceae bacterium]